MNRLYAKKDTRVHGDSPVQSFRLPPDEVFWLERHCRKNGFSKAKVFREMFELYRQQLSKSEVG